MAAAWVGGAFLSASLQVLFDRMASREFLDFFKGQKLDDKLLKQLKSTMRAVNKVLNDAEKKQITDPAVKEWVDELKDAVYEADDLLDEIAYEGLRAKLEASTQSSADPVQNFVSSFNPFNNSGVNANLEKILESLEDLVQQMRFLGLKDDSGEKPLSYKAPTTSLVDESGVYGRDDDKTAILNLLLSDDANGKNLGVIVIVGMGGVGKTTLAQLAYNNTAVQQGFDLRAWICVSEEFNSVNVTKDILKGFRSGNCDAMIPDHLHVELENLLKGKKVLLVLDDIWNCDSNFWDFLLTPFKSGVTQRSRIIVTTRIERVASVMSTVLTDASFSTCHLHALSPDDFWSVFARHAFDGGSSGAHGDLEEIGKKIVEKCNGLPLAAKILGGLLRSNTDVEEWENILESNMWDLADDKILPALRLSYHYLPSHLKQCFAYCSLFPKDHEFQKEDLVLLWMAEGFLEQPRGKEIEGNKCFDDLVSRSFFQQSSVHPSCFIMHDLLNDLAKFVSGEFCFRFEGADSSRPTEQTRHLSCATTKYYAFAKFEGLCEAQFLRSFLLIRWLEVRAYQTLDFLLSLKRLRVLSLSCYRDVTKLAVSIGHLKHLRYLNLQYMAIKRLPESVSNLYYLQTLILYGCSELVELPTNMMKLINMCHLDIRLTNVQLMPPQMGKLMKLQRLTDFLVGKLSGSSIKELGKLQHLRGEICIQNLQNVVNVQDAAEANLKSKKHLRKLKLNWDRYNDDSPEEVLEQLQPHTKTESLSIHKYGGIKFPNWIGDSSFSNILSLKLIGCAHCSSLPPLGQLASLKDLTVTDFDAVETVDLNFYGSCSSMKVPFGSLEVLRFERSPKWQEWICDIGGAFPVLRELYIIKCPNLKKALPNHLPSLTKLQITQCDQLVAALPRAPSILEITWENFLDPRFIRLKKLPSGLQSLEVREWDSLDSALERIEQMGVVFNALEEIHIYWCDCESLCAYEESLGNFTSLRLLKIGWCPNLKRLPERLSSLLPSLAELHINDCPGIESIPEGGFPSKLVSLDIKSCDKLIADLCLKWDLVLLPSLVHFAIGVESFPEKPLPSTVTTLSLQHIQNLESLDYKRLQHLTSLKELTIDNWPHLQSLGIQHLTSLKKLTIFYCKHVSFTERLPPTLSDLRIWGCLSLAKRCKREKGEDWPKISHIPNIFIR